MEGVGDERLHPVEGEHQQARDAITAGRPDRPRNVPTGVSRRSGPSPTRTPAAIAGTVTIERAVRPNTTRAAPAATRVGLDDAPSPEAHGRRGVGDESGQRPQGAHDERADHHDRRRQPEEHPAPSEGVRHPLGEDRADQARHDPGRRHHREQPGPLVLVEHTGDGDYATAGMMPAPSPWMNRPATSTDIDGASPPNRSPAVNVAMPHASAGANPAALGQLATLDDADHRAEEERRGDPPVPHHPLEVGLDVGEDADHRQRLRRRDDGAGHEAELHARAARTLAPPHSPLVPLVLVARSPGRWLPDERIGAGAIRRGGGPGDRSPGSAP